MATRRTYTFHLAEGIHDALIDALDAEPNKKAFIAAALQFYIEHKPADFFDWRVELESFLDLKFGALTAAVANEFAHHPISFPGVPSREGDDLDDGIKAAIVKSTRPGLKRRE
jgi:hypothetical protein